MVVVTAAQQIPRKSRMFSESDESKNHRDEKETRFEMGCPTYSTHASLASAEFSGMKLEDNVNG